MKRLNLFLFTLLMSCNPLQEQSKIQVFPDNGLNYSAKEYTDPFFYIPVQRDRKFEEYLADLVIEADDDITVEEYLDDGHVLFTQHHDMEKLLNSIVTEMLTKYYAKHPEFSHIPIPEVFILRFQQLNAFVTAANVCYDIPLKIEGSSNVEKTEVIGFTQSNGKLIANISDCIEEKNRNDLSLSERERYIRFFNKEYESCSLRWEQEFEGFVLNGKENCNLISRFSGSDKIAIKKTLQGIFLMEELFDTKISFSSLTSIIAHELIHYLRGHAHATFVSDVKPIAYEVLKRDFNRVPEFNSALNLDLLDSLGNESLTTIDDPSLFYHPIVARFMFDLGFQIHPQKICENSRLNNCQQQYQKLTRALDIVFSNSKFPSGNFNNQEHKKMYLQFESDLIEFAKTVPHKNWLKNDVQYFLQESGHFPEVRNIPELLAFEDQGSTYDFLSLLSIKKREYDKIKYAKREQIAQQGLGKYTTEVEADENMLVLLHEAGYLSELSSEIYSFLRNETDRFSRRTNIFNYPADICDEMRSNNWSVIPVWGDPRNAHPSTCWRMYNIDRLSQSDVLGSSQPSISFDSHQTSFEMLLNIGIDFNK